MQSNTAPRRPSEVISHYLEAIYYIRGEGEAVRSARLAEWLGVSRPTVTVALRRMVRDGMVRFSGREVELTEPGQAAAAAIVRRHRIVERWLTETLGMDWLIADEEAARLEHAVSRQVEDRLFEALGRPRTCPHGNPIPGAAEPDPAEVRLATLAAGARARISRISEVAEREAPALLEYLGETRLFPGTEVGVLGVSAGGGTIRLDVGGREVTMSRATAEKVWVIA